MIIAVDFDGTIVEHKYPAIGRELPFAIETLRKLQSDRHKLILWTVREGGLLEEALSFCRERGLEFYAVNRDYPEEERDRNNHFSRKPEGGRFHRRPQPRRPPGLGHDLRDGDQGTEL